MTKTVDTAVITVRGIKILFIKSQLFIRPTPAGINIRGMVSRKKFPGPSTASSFTALRHSKAKSRKSPYTPAGIGNGSRTYYGDAENDSDALHEFHLQSLLIFINAYILSLRFSSHNRKSSHFSVEIKRIYGLYL